MTDLTYSAMWLANDADCMSPDAPDSPGAQFLLSIQSGVNDIEDDDIKADTDDERAGDWAHEIAEHAVPIYTYQMWQTFVELGAFNEDPSELGAEPDDMNGCAGVALFQIAYRLAVALIEERKKELTDSGEDNDDEGDE